jgi:hypothetical protein
MKRCALSLVLACLGLAVLLLVAGCVDASRDAMIQGDTYSRVYEIEAWNEHARYLVGEKVHMRVTLTNLSSESQVWGDTKAFTPVVDIHVFSAKRADNQAEEYQWSQEHPDEAKYSITLKPGESYVIKWEFAPRLKDHYYAFVEYALAQGESNILNLSFSYGVQPPGPLP